MKQKLWIFGDSFADPRYNPTTQFKTWHYQLEENFEVENFGISGSGPEWSLQQFLKLDESTPNHEKKNINILFLGSQWTRFNFSCYKQAGDQLLITQLGKSDVEYKGIFVKFAEYVEYKKFVKFARAFLTYYVPNNNHNNNQFILQNMLLLNHYTRHYKKCVYWPIFEPIEEEVRELYNSEKFYIVKDMMRELEIFEPFGKETYPNHMPEKSHNIVYQKVMKFL